MRDEDFRFCERRPDTWVGAAKTLETLRQGAGEPRHHTCSLGASTQIHTQRGGRFAGQNVGTGLNTAGRVASRDGAA